MGITLNTMKMLKAVQSQGVSYERTGTVGRQMFWRCNEEAVAQFLGSNVELKGNFDVSDGQVSDEFFKWLGASKLESIDANSYEGATRILDLNLEVEGAHHERYSALFDGGSLEHIFNVVVALKNMMSMIERNGHLISCLPCNGWAGHGFYQFSPEFFYRALSEENGFTQTKVFIYSESGDFSPILFPDPAAVGRRIEFQPSGQISLCSVSKRASIVPIFSRMPHQSDYEIGRWK